jgi:hypothetical protein
MPTNNKDIKKILEITTEEEDYENDYPASYAAIFQCTACKDIFALSGSSRSISFDLEKLKEEHKCDDKQ